MPTRRRLPESPPTDAACHPKTQLPPDYIDLEKRVDALKQVHQKMLAVT